MSKIYKLVLLFVAIALTQKVSAENGWKRVENDLAPTRLQVMHPNHFLVYTLDETSLKRMLWNLSSDQAEAIVLSLPLPNGSFRDFRVWQTSLMPDELAAKYPGIKSFTGVAVDDQRVTAKLDYTLFGFDAMVFDGENTSFIDPYDNYSDGFYMVHYKRDETKAFSARMVCEVKDEDQITTGEQKLDLVNNTPTHNAARTVNGWYLRTYRLALSANHFYCQAATGLTTPTIAQALSKMTVTMNRINGVYNREFSVQMNFCTKEDTLIWPTNTGSVNGNDPFNTINANAGSCLTANQTQCNNRIGSANYDLGHVFTTGAGGLSSLGVVCTNGQKAKSVTGGPSPVGDGFDIDFVAHEMGHEFGANHTFNNGNDGSCGGGNIYNNTAYEPGSGSTIMAYAGICPPDDLQPHSDAYFHAASLTEIVTKLNGSENVCAVVTPTSNKLVSLPLFSTSYTIPYKTPFELIGPTAVDSVADTANTYCWEQWNRGDAGSRLVNTFLKGPIFRSYNPVNSTTRVFPKIGMVLAGVLSNAGSENAQGEKAADTARYMTFKMTVRDILGGYGCITFPDDTIHVTAVSTGAANAYAGFKVTSQGTTGISYTGGTNQSVTWNVVGTNAAPVSATNVTIWMSRDGGLTWPDSIGTYPNTGTALVTVPNPTATITTARFKVKGSGNIFFNVNGKNFAVTHGTTSHAGVSNTASAFGQDVKVYPVPATDMLHIDAAAGNISVTVLNTVGQVVYTGAANGNATIPVNTWARGVYYVRVQNTADNNVVVKRVVLQ